MQPNNFLSLEQVIDRQPLIVTPETPAIEVIKRMQEWGNNCYLTENTYTPDADITGRINNSYALIVEDDRLQGIFTERDLVRLIATERDLSETAVNKVMTRELITLTATGTEDVFTALNLLLQHSIRHLPIVDRSDRLLGLITEKNLCQNLKSNDLVAISLAQDVSEGATALRDRAEAVATLAESEQLFRNMADHAPMMVWVTDEMGNYTYLSQGWYEFTGQTEETGLGFGWLDAVHPEDRERTQAIFLRATQLQEAFRLDYRLRCHDGEYRWAIDAAKPWIGNNGQFKGYIGSVIDISERKSREIILKDIASGVTIPTGVNFLPSLVEYLSKTLKVDYAFVAELIPSATDKIKTLAVYGQGKTIDNFEYHLLGTPCQNVVGRQFCIYPQTVQQLFPDDQLLQDLAAESYAGMPIFNSNVTALGLIAVMDSKPLADISLIEEVLKIFATRVTAELERQQAESIIKESEQRFRAIFNQTHQFMGLLTPDGTLLEANQNSLDFIGATLADMQGKPFWETPWWSISVDIQEQLKEAIALAAKGELVRYEVNHRGVGGRVITVDFSLKPLKDETGKVIMLIPESRDITERKQAEAKIREQAALLDIATDAIMVRGLDDRILFWNRGAEKLYGWTKAEALNRKAYELLYRQYPTQLSKIQQALTEQGEWQGEINQVTKAGQDMVVQSRWSLVRDEAGNPSSYLVVKSDITEQKQLEAQFLRTQRLESLGTLAGGIAHDLNNILAPILGFAKLLPLKLTDLDEETKGFFQIMETNAQRGTALVKQILTFSRGLEGDRGTVQIRHLIAEIKQIIAETFPKSIELAIGAPKNLWTVNADVNQLHQILMNLAVNGRDAMPDGGKLTIEAENFTVDREYAKLHLDAIEGSYVLITVADTGVGIPPEIIDRIFEPFFTTKEVGRGTGLGLSTVIGIVKSHGGFVDVVSQTQRGTQFKVFLPASKTAAITTEAAAELPPGNGELILVVDDEPSILVSTKATLTTYNYRVLTAEDGIDAIALYTQNQAEIHVVLMDLIMPEMSGLTAMRTLKKINPSVKLIANSGLAEKDKITAAERIGIKAFLAKPYTAETLLRQLKDVITAN